MDHSRDSNMQPRRAGGNTDLKPGDWICDGCSNNNFARRTECRDCGKPRSGQCQVIGAEAGFASQGYDSNAAYPPRAGYSGGGGGYSGPGGSVQGGSTFYDDSPNQGQRQSGASPYAGEQPAYDPQATTPYSPTAPSSSTSPAAPTAAADSTTATATGNTTNASGSTGTTTGFYDDLDSSITTAPVSSTEGGDTTSKDTAVPSSNGAVKAGEDKTTEQSTAAADETRDPATTTDAKSGGDEPGTEGVGVGKKREAENLSFYADDDADGDADGSESNKRVRH